MQCPHARQNAELQNPPPKKRKDAHRKKRKTPKSQYEGKLRTFRRLLITNRVLIFWCVVMPKICQKCGSQDFGIWTSSSTGKIHLYCRNCRRRRASEYTSRKTKNGGAHSRREWLQQLSKYAACPLCRREWDSIPHRPDKRYRYVWTKDHIVPLNQGGNDTIQNIQPLCYQCNSSKCDGRSKQKI
jgi:hypothetical protein